MAGPWQDLKSVNWDEEEDPTFVSAGWMMRKSSSTQSPETPATPS